MEEQQASPSSVEDEVYLSGDDGDGDGDEVEVEMEKLKIYRRKPNLDAMH
jgi:hypothetical protein